MFNLETSDHCNHDYVEVRDTNSSGTVLGRYCGSQMPNNMTVAHDLWIKFKSNEAVASAGFMAVYNSGGLPFYPMLPYSLH